MAYASSSHPMLTVVGTGATSAHMDRSTRRHTLALRLNAPDGTGASGSNTSVVVQQGTDSSCVNTDGAVMVDNQAQGRLVLQPDGSLHWELTDAPRHGAWEAAGRLALVSAEGAVAAIIGCGGIMGVLAATMEIIRAEEKSYNISGHQLMTLIAVTTSSSAAGLAAGVVYAPLLAARHLLGRFSRPALVLGAALTLGRGARRAVTLWRWSASALLRSLSSGAAAERLEALERIAERAAQSPRFRRAWVKLGGLQQLLHLLSPRAGAGVGGLVDAVLQALEALLADPDAADAATAAGGAPALAHLLSHVDDGVAGRAAVLLAALGAGAGPGAATAAATLVDAGAVPLLVAALARPDGGAPPAEGACVSGAARLLAALATDAAGQAAMAHAGAPAALLALLSKPLPRTPAKEAAVDALTTFAAGGGEQLQTLASLPGAASVLDGALTAWGPGWYPCKPDLHQVTALLAHASAAGDAIFIDRPAE